MPIDWLGTPRRPAPNPRRPRCRSNQPSSRARHDRNPGRRPPRPRPRAEPTRPTRTREDPRDAANAQHDIAPTPDTAGQTAAAGPAMPPRPHRAPAATPPDSVSRDPRAQWTEFRAAHRASWLPPHMPRRAATAARAPTTTPARPTVLNASGLRYPVSPSDRPRRSRLRKWCRSGVGGIGFT